MESYRMHSVKQNRQRARGTLINHAEVLLNTPVLPTDITVQCWRVRPNRETETQKLATWIFKSMRTKYTLCRMQVFHIQSFR